MKQLIIILILTFVAARAYSQTDTDTIRAPDTNVIEKIVVVPKPVRIRNVPRPVKKRVTDSTTRKDTIAIGGLNAALPDTTAKNFQVNSLPVKKKPVVGNKPFDRFYAKLLDNPFFRSRKNPIFLVIKERQQNSKDEMFYLVLGLLTFLAFIKLVFSRYFQNVFKLFFQPTFRQKQTREQLQQGNLPSLLLNLFFIFSAAAYFVFLLTYNGFSQLGFWMLFIYSSLLLLVMYTGKYILLRFAGWVFNIKEAADVYIFSVYLINKIIGVVLIPFTIIIAFSYPSIINVSITISVLAIVLLFLYRYRVSYPAVRKEVKISPLHFLFYVFAFEIIPLLLIYKTLMLYLNKSL